MVLLLTVLLAAPPTFTTVEPGLELARWPAPQQSSHGDSLITLVRIDPAKHTLRLLMASELGGGSRTVADWATTYKLRLVVNAGMFETGSNRHKASYLMRSRRHVNNGHLGTGNAVLAFDPLIPSVPPAQIIDRQCQDFDSVRAHYGTLIQGIRISTCQGRNVWSRQPKKWSMVVVATDAAGRVLFAFTRSPYQVHDFAAMLLSAGIGIGSMMYLEGGPEASLLVHAGTTRLNLMGSYETGFYERDDNDHFWPIPNVLGL